MDESDISDMALVTTTQVSSNSGSATFAIPRSATLKSDLTEHKVTIGQFSLSPEIRHWIVPKMEEAAYFQSTTKNNSDYPFLASNRVAIFLEGTFITKTQIAYTSPGEKFIVFLGVDPSLKVKFLTLKDVSSKGKEGSVFKGNVKAERVLEYVTQLHNTGRQAVEVTLVNMLPRADDAQIEVLLLQPRSDQLTRTKTTETGGADGEGQLALGTIMQNKLTNNIVHNISIPPDGKRDVPFSFAVKSPPNGQKVEIAV